MNLLQYLKWLEQDKHMQERIAAWHTMPPREASFAPFPAATDARLTAAFRLRGIDQLYSHQRKAVQAAMDGKDVVVVTPTASGKTLCYNVPVLDAVLKDGNARALYLFPTKALSSDQASELNEVIAAIGEDIKAFTYDGDTSVSARKAVRQAGHIVVSNPDMLHSGILPNHTKWVKLFENLKYIVIDELHTYRGVFGSHLANVLRRLLRICDFYGSRPQFIGCSATIKNPDELMRMLTGRDAVMIDENGAPSGTRHFIFINPPVVNRQLGIRKSALMEARGIASDLIKNNISTIVFARSRLSVEVLVTYLKRLVRDPLGESGRVRGYRGGYLPLQRRQIERGLRAGDITGVVSTNALELGIDIGSLDACVLCGYPGTVASTWQRAGRAGRRSGVSATFLIGNSSPLDQYILAHPDYFFTQPPEHGTLNPENLYILMSHFKCAAFELPFADGETFGGVDRSELLQYLEQEGVLRHTGGQYHWMTQEFPASEVSLRSASSENFAIIDITLPKHRVIGEMDRYTVPMLLHEKAIYLHEGQPYQVEKLDFEFHKGYVRKVDADYYTDADMSVNLKVLDVFEQDEGRAYGEAMVSTIVTIFKKLKFDTHENIGWGEVNLPEQQMHTTAYWATVPPHLLEGEDREDAESAMLGIANVLAQAAPMYLMCDPRDISVSFQVRAPFTNLPTLFIYDSLPGGVGFSEKLYNLHEQLLSAAREMIDACPCEQGCPSCVGPSGEVGSKAKQMALRILGVMCDGSKSTIAGDAQRT